MTLKNISKLLRKMPFSGKSRDLKKGNQDKNFLYLPAEMTRLKNLRKRLGND